MLTIVLFISSLSFAENKKPHKTETGRHTFFFVESKDLLPWDEDQQMEFDNEVDDVVRAFCFKNALIKKAQATIDHEKAIAKETGFINAKAMHDAGSIIVRMKPETDKLAKFLKEATQKDASSYECQ